MGKQTFFFPSSLAKSLRPDRRHVIHHGTHLSGEERVTFLAALEVRVMCWLSQLPTFISCCIIYCILALILVKEDAWLEIQGLITLLLLLSRFLPVKNDECYKTHIYSIIFFSIDIRIYESISLSNKPKKCLSISARRSWGTLWRSHSQNIPLDMFVYGPATVTNCDHRMTFLSCRVWLFSPRCDA